MGGTLLVITFHKTLIEFFGNFFEVTLLWVISVHTKGVVILKEEICMKCAYYSITHKICIKRAKSKRDCASFKNIIGLKQDGM